MGDDPLQSFADEVGHDLVCPSSIEGMRPAFELLRAAEPELAFECHLDDTQRVDLTLRVTRQGRGALARSLALPPRIARVAATWARPDHPLHDAPFIEFEFDLPEFAMMPWVGPAVEPRLRDGARAIQATRDFRSGGHAAVSPLFDAALALDGTLPLTPGSRARVVDAVQRLPRFGVIGQIARLDGRAARPREGVRLFASMPRSAFASYFAALDYRHARSLLAIIDDLKPHTTWLDFDFGVHEGEVEPTFGWYVEFRGPRVIASELRRTVECLVAERMCRYGTAASLMRWMSAVDARQDRVLTVKFVLDPSHGDVRAKLYLSALRGPTGIHGSDQPRTSHTASERTNSDWPSS